MKANGGKFHFSEAGALENINIYVDAQRFLRIEGAWKLEE